MTPPGLPSGHPFLCRDGGVWIDGESRLDVVRRSGVHDLVMILERTPRLQKSVRLAAERRLRRLYAGIKSEVAAAERKYWDKEPQRQSEEER